MDKLKYRIFNWLWVCWHMRWRSFFDRFAPACSDCAETITMLREMTPPSSFSCYHAKYVITPRPWWHMCCNGDAGGWRTSVCDWLEGHWRSTYYYSER